MRKKIYSMLALLCLTVTSAWADADVTWNSSNVSDIRFWGGAPDGYDSYTKEGITLRGNAEGCDAEWADFGNGPGIMFAMNKPYTGGYTFIAPDGKKFTKIEITATTNEGWYTYAFFSQLESGWPAGEEAAADFNSTLKFTWTGSAASVNLATTLESFGPSLASSIDFYFEASAEPEPQPVGYTVSLKAETADEGNWTAKAGEGDYQSLPLEGVAEGTQVTVTYSGLKKVKSVKAVKKAAAPAAKAAAEATAEDKGKLIGTDGKIYADVEAATAAGTTAVAKIIYIGTTGHATYNHGLALALNDEESKMAWQDAIDACSAKNTSIPVTGATWLLASQAQWDYMLGTDGAGSHYDLRDGFSSVGGSNLQWNYYYSSTEDDSDSSNAWYYSFAYGIWLHVKKGNNNYVRACLAF